MQDALLDGIFSKEDYAAKVKRIDESIEEIKADLKKSSTALEDIRAIDALLSDMDKTINDFLGLKENEHFDIAYLLKSIEKIVIEPDTVDLVMPCLSFDIGKREIVKSTVCTNKHLPIK